MECFKVFSNDIEGRIDPNPYHPIRLNSIKKIKSCKCHFLLLKDVIEFKRNIVTTKSDDEIYVGLENIESNSGEYVPSDEPKENFGSAFKFQKGDILFPKLRPYLNKVHLAKIGGVCSTEFYVLKAIKCDSSYLFAFLNSKLVVNQTSYLMTGNTLPRLQTAEVEQLIIPIPEEKIQHDIAQLLDDAYELKKQKETDAQQLLDSFEDILVNENILNLHKIKQQKIFSINLKDLDGALNPERYANRIRYDDSVDWILINDVGSICRNTFTPEKSNPDDEYSLLRIDDLDNNPILAVIRNVKGKEINGTILKVQTNDVLTARLGPTIENKKIVLAPKLKSNLIASNEFICLRCNENNNPIFVLNLLKTNFYKKIMIQNTRGATPSRRRLSHEDFSKLPFPKIDIEIQNEIAEEIEERTQKAQQLENGAKKIIEEAKERVERIILGEEEI